MEIEMSKTSEITVAERQILDLINFRSNADHVFFGSNEYIGDCISIQKTSAKNMVNKLVKLGYLKRVMDGKKRVLYYTGKAYEPIVGDLSNYDKAYLRKEVDHYKHELKNAEDDMTLMKIEIDQLKDKIEEQKITIHDNTHAIVVLKNILEQLGIDEAKLTAMFPAVYKEIYGDN